MLSTLVANEKRKLRQLINQAREEERKLLDQEREQWDQEYSQEREKEIVETAMVLLEMGVSVEKVALATKLPLERVIELSASSDTSEE